MKNKLTNKLSNLFKSSCVVFTAVVFSFYILQRLITKDQGNWGLDLMDLFLVLLTSIWFTATNVFLTNKKLNIILRVAMHFVSSTLGFYLIFIYLTGYAKKSSNAFLLVIAFAVAYIIVAVAILAIRNFIIKKKTQDKEKYESIYKDEE
ncbi:MAG: hypothetical protein E7574_01620 [Ruminococcaceae bacterium]|nr:hypothetical protein [Oscillospiraceae bacterium]